MHLETISSAAKQTLSRLKKFKDLNRFYLAGGTALALQIGHRISVDFDWFTGKSLPRDLKSGLKKLFNDGEFEPEVDKKEELTVPLSGVKNTFFRYPFRLVYPLVEAGGFKMADIREIALMKALAIGRRATLRDYVDLYFIFKSGIDINDVLSKVKVKYGNNFDQRMFLEQLVYIGDVKKQNIRFLRGDISEKKIKSFFEQLVKTVKV